MKILRILIVILVLTVGAIAQKAVLSGTVYDANGAVIPETKITATNENGEKFETTSNGEGIYVLKLPYNPYVSGNADFKVAQYEIIIRRKNFDKSVLKNFKFVASTKGKMFLDFVLEVSTPENLTLVDSDRGKYKNKEGNNK